MTRDMDLIRQIVLALRDDVRSGPLIKLESVDQLKFNYHALLLVEAGLVTGIVEPVRNGIPMRALLHQLTWDGQDFAESIKSDTVWEKAKENVMKPLAGWTFSILRDYLKAELSKYLPPL
ncbi:DUF2513 domain-containing protein [Candidatus Symbiopectobacterium sp. NZEC135]|uniref:DUF2513 domain-containing protein n=1 Tax=Candidatus Symbiopectobacterium sp. NZEC135 TaxID=2820471 RepID=UPI0022274AE8|nr:DUF2513 domain-containing protein [Candidatus Symbiopectobacterium sp. NZEC135]MCW2478852.1 DUF2513 domain-containing protein [Candidatus Symbiopectobacterium sp. NZEC135]